MLYYFIRWFAHKEQKMAKEQFDKSLLKLHHPNEIHKELDQFKNEWRYEKVDKSFMHKTGLKFFIEKDERSGRSQAVINKKNIEGWERYMNGHFGLNRAEINLYRERLFQEFYEYLQWYANQLKQAADNMDISIEVLPYLIQQSMNNRYKS